MPWAVAAAVVSAGAAYYSSQQQKKAAQSAAETQARGAERAAELQYKASREALQFQKEQYAKIEPYLTKSLSGYQELLQRPEAYKQTPGYMFRLQQGLQTIGIPKGGRNLSGAQMRRAIQFGEEYATAEYQNALARVAGLGSLAQGVYTVGAQYAGAAGQAVMAGGQARAQGALGSSTALARGQMGAAEAQSAGYMGVASAFGQGLVQYGALRNLRNQQTYDYGYSGGYGSTGTSWGQ